MHRLSCAGLRAEDHIHFQRPKAAPSFKVTRLTYSQGWARNPKNENASMSDHSTQISQENLFLREARRFQKAINGSKASQPCIHAANDTGGLFIFQRHPHIPSNSLNNQRTRCISRRLRPRDLIPQKCDGALPCPSSCDTVLFEAMSSPFSEELPRRCARPPLTRRSPNTHQLRCSALLSDPESYPWPSQRPLSSTHQSTIARIAGMCLCSFTSTLTARFFPKKIEASSLIPLTCRIHPTIRHPHNHEFYANKDATEPRNLLSSTIQPCLTPVSSSSRLNSLASVLDLPPHLLCQYSSYGDLNSPLSRNLELLKSIKGPNLPLHLPNSSQTSFTSRARYIMSFRKTIRIRAPYALLHCVFKLSTPLTFSNSAIPKDCDVLLTFNKLTGIGQAQQQIAWK